MSTTVQDVRHRALVAYASKHGSTAGIASEISAALLGRGFDTDLWPAREVRSVDGYDLVVVGSALYMFRWQGDAVHLLERFERVLTNRPTWLFSSGPTGGTPDADEKLAVVLATQPAPPNNVAKLAERIGVRGHHTFGGRAGPEMGGLMERWIPKGDWRDLDAVRAWANEIADTVEIATPAAVG